MERGVKPEQKRLFIIDGSKALRAGITEVFGEQPVQRCRLHKERNVVEPLPEGRQEEVREQMRSAWKLPAEQGIAQLEKLATTLEKSAPSVANSLREGLQEMFTINRLGLPSSLQRSFSSTNVIDSTLNGTRRTPAMSLAGRMPPWHSDGLPLLSSKEKLISTRSQGSNCLEDSRTLSSN